MLTQKRLKEVLRYCPKSGGFLWLVTTKRLKKGDVAGFIGNLGYRKIKIDTKAYLAHRLAWLYIYGDFPENQIDHVNGVRHDNRISNLRDVTAADNMKNRRRAKNNKSGLYGVYLDPRTKRWVARIGVDKSVISLGGFEKKEEAFAARAEAEKKYGFHPNHGK